MRLFSLRGHFIGIINDDGECGLNRLGLKRGQRGGSGVLLFGFQIPQGAINCIARRTGQQGVQQCRPIHSGFQSGLNGFNGGGDGFHALAIASIGHGLATPNHIAAAQFDGQNIGADFAAASDGKALF